jgi:hypothetical protein
MPDKQGDGVGRTRTITSLTVSASPRYPPDHEVTSWRQGCTSLLPQLESVDSARNVVRSASLVRPETVLDLFHIGLVLAATEHLYDQIDWSLEDTLVELRTKHSNGPPTFCFGVISPARAMKILGLQSAYSVGLHSQMSSD